MYVAITQTSYGNLNKGLYVIEKIEDNSWSNVIYYRPMLNKVTKKFYRTVVIKPQTIAVIYDLERKKIIFKKTSVDNRKLKMILRQRIRKFLSDSDDKNKTQ